MKIFDMSYDFTNLHWSLCRWCGPCKQLAPKLDSLIDMKDGAVELAKVDIDENAELAMEYGVCSSNSNIALKNQFYMCIQVGHGFDITYKHIQRKELYCS